MIELSCPLCALKLALSVAMPILGKRRHQVALTLRVIILVLSFGSLSQPILVGLRWSEVIQTFRGSLELDHSIEHICIRNASPFLESKVIQ